MKEKESKPITRYQIAKEKRLTAELTAKHGSPQADESIEAYQNPEAYGTIGYDDNERFMFG